LFEQSFFYSFAMAIWRKIVHFAQFSFIAGWFSAISRGLASVWRKSLTQRTLQQEFELEQKMQSGIMGRFFNKITRLAQKTSNACGPHIVQSGILKFISRFLENLPYTNLRSPGVMFVIFGVFAVIAEFIQSINGAFAMPILPLAVAAVGGALILLNRSFVQLFGGSLFIKWVLRFFFVEELNESKQVVNSNISFLIIGAVLGLLWIFLSPTNFIMVAGGAIGAILVFYKTEIGIFAAAFLIPLVPTMLVLGLFMLIVVSFFAKAFLTGSIPVKFTVIDLFVVVFAAVVGYSVIISYNMASSAPVAAVYILFTLFYFVAKNVINTRQKLSAVLSLIMISGLLVAAYGIYQRITGNFVMTEAWIDIEMFDPSMVRIYSTLENPNVLGEYLIFIIIISFAGLYYFREYLHKITSLGILGIAGITMILTQSRGAWLGLIFAFGIYALIRDRRIVVLGIIALAMAPMLIPVNVIERFLSIGDLTDSSTAYRVFIWLGSLDMIAVFWPIGIGLGTDTFMFMYHKFAYNAVFSPHSHNLYLQIIIDLGIAGLLTFFAIITAFFKTTLVAAHKESPRNSPIPAAIAAAMFGFLVQGMTDNVWFNYRVTAFFWLVLALGACFVNISQDKNRETEENGGLVKHETEQI